MQENIFRSAIKSGLVLGALFTLNFFLSIPQNTGLTYTIVVGIVMFIAMCVVMWKLSIKYRDNECEGIISYGKSLGFILLTFFYASLISAVVMFVYVQIDPDYLIRLGDDSLKTLERLGLPIDDNVYESIRNSNRPLRFTINSIFGNMILGLIVGLIIAVFVKKEKGVFEE